MAQKAAKHKKKTDKAKLQKRRERRFSTSVTYMPLWVGLVGMLGCFALGTGVFAQWILDTPLEYGQYLVAAGGLGLGVALWFGQPPETAVAVGDSGIAVETGRDTSRVKWYDLRSLHVAGGSMIAEGGSFKLKFLLGANKNAAAAILKEAAERVPDVVDIDSAITEGLPNPEEVKGFAQDVEDDQVTGIRCAASKKAINMEEDARLCPRCGQVFHKDGVPNECTSCETPLKNHTLRA